jgi:cytochrome c553
MRHAVTASVILVLASALGLGAASQPETTQPAPAKPAQPTFNRDYLNGPPPAVPVPAWAFARDPPATSDLKRRPDDDAPRHVPGSTLALPRQQALNLFDAIDWHPDDHPPAPDVVMHGHRPQLVACAFCHRPNGVGEPENAPLAGLPAAYIIQQFHDYVDKTRQSADMRMASFHGMADYIAPRISDDDLKTVAAYYASLKLKPYLKVIETDTAPKMHSIQYTMVPVPEGGTEPIGDRILETPSDLARFDLSDSELGYTVYVPKGSIRKGEVLAKTGGGRTLACVSCHGADLRGVGDIPPIAGRGPSNLVRQLYDIKLGARSSADVALMKAVVANLTDEDIVDVVAYAASRKP